MSKAQPAGNPPIVVIFGDEAYQKAAVLKRALDELLPPEVDRALALGEYDGTQSEDQGGPTFATVMDDLATLPFLAERRVVLVRDADKFVSACRDKLESYLKAPSPTGTLILECRSLPKNTRLYKAAGAGGRLHECKKLVGRDLIDFVFAEAQARGKRIDYPAAARLAGLIGPEQGALSAEVEKLSLYAADCTSITIDDVAELVGQSREEKIFAVMDAAGTADLPTALRLWDQVLTTDPAAVYRAVGGMAYVVRRWLAAHQMLSDGLPLAQVAPRVMMWRRERELGTILRRFPPRRLKQILAAISTLDSQAKLGTRSIEAGVEALLLELAA
jgi:DNA polymerase-3 subunit delta